MIGGWRSAAGVFAVSVLVLALSSPAQAAAGTRTTAPAHSSSGSPPTAPTAPTGQWITAAGWASAPVVGGASPVALPILAKDFSVKAGLVSASLSISGEGVYSATIDGAPVSPAVLEPGYSVDTRAYYSTYDITALVANNSSHRIGVQLGSGIWAEATSPGRYSKLSHVAGPVAVNATLTLSYGDGTSGSVATDPTWQATTGPTTVADWYGGEDFDNGRVTPGWQQPGTTLATWSTAVIAAMPPGLRLTAKIGPPIIEQDTVTSVGITQPAPGVYVVDFGRQVGGWPVLHVSGPAGTRVKLTPTEVVSASTGLVNSSSFAGLYDSYTLSGSASAVQTWHPQFVYHGFRYVQLEGMPSPPTPATLSAIDLSTDTDAAGSFNSSDPTLTTLHSLTSRAITNNSMSVLTDCPDREKLGWLEEVHLVFDALAAHQNLGYQQPGVAGTYGQRIEHIIADSQTPAGLIPDTAPEYTVFPGGFRDDVNWGGTLVQMPWDLYRSYGDATTMSTYYPNMQRYLNYLNGQLGRGGTGLIGTALGDWFTEAKGPNGTGYALNNALIENVGLYNALTTMANIGRVLGRPDVAVWSARAAALAAAINSRWLTPTGDYGPDQASNAVPLAAGIVPAAQIASTRTALLTSITAAGGRFKLGEISIGPMLTALSAMGRDDIAYQAVISTAGRGYGAIAASGATALTEGWGGAADGASQDHFMLGAVDSWMSQDIAGLKQSVGSVDWANLTITPQLITGMTSASATHITDRGTIRVAWSRPDATADAAVTIDLPAGTTATVVLPSGTSQIGAGRSLLSTGPQTTWTTVLPRPQILVYSIGYNNALYTTVNGRITYLTAAVWAAAGYPKPVRLNSTYTRYSFGPAVYAVTNFPAVTAALVESVSYAGWRQAGFPKVVVVTRLITNSTVTQWDGDPAVILRNPDGTFQHLSAAQWTALGRPTLLRFPNQRWVALAGGPTILLLTNFSAGIGHVATLSEWTAAGRPTALTHQILHGSTWIIHAGNPQIYLQLPASAPIPITFAEWTAAGRPRPTVV